MASLAKLAAIGLAQEKDRAARVTRLKEKLPQGKKSNENSCHLY